MPHSYEAAHRKALETAKALQRDLNRLNNECREGHGSAVRVDIDLGSGPEIDLGPSQEVELGPILKVGPGIEQELKVKAVTVLTPRMSIPAPWPMVRNP